MFVTSGRRRTPSDTPFLHDASCRTKAAKPEWERVEDGHWQRTCSCNVEHRRLMPERPAAPDAALHRHGVDENDDPCDATAKVVWVDDGDGYWSTRCKECATRVVYWQHHRQTLPDGTLEPLPVGAVPVPGYTP